MGRVKEEMMEAEECGLNFVDLQDDKFVCAKCCFDDKYVKMMVNGKSQSDAACSYCEKLGAAPFGKVMLWIMEYVTQEWSYDPIACGAGYDSETKDYLYRGMINGPEEVMCEVGLCAGNSDFWEDATQSMNAEWCLRGVLEISLSESLRCGWNAFCETAKRVSGKDLLQEWPPNDIVDENDLLAVCTEVLNHAHIRNFKAGETLLYRARSGLHNTEAALLAPPREYAPAGRMSPAGIPMLYCAMDRATTACEISEKLREALSVATFRVTVDIPILDLSDLPPLPSFFGPDREHRESIKAILGFAHDIAQPVGKGDSDNANYIPTQIFAGHLAKIEGMDASPKIGGIIYDSAQNQKKEGKCCVIFPRFARGGMDGNLCLENIEHFAFKDGKWCKQKNVDE